MSTGMLWFDNDPKLDLPAKIQRAMDYYQKSMVKNRICAMSTPLHLAINQ